MAIVSKNELDNQVAAIDAIRNEDLPTQLMGGSVVSVHRANYIRKLKKQTIAAHQQECLNTLIAAMVAAGHTDAAGVIQLDRLVIYPDGLPIVEDI
jgi:hypothetical protein